LTTRKKIRLIHTSDTHLGSDWRPDIVADAFRAVVDGVTELKGDALLVVGDVFDHARIPDEILEFFLDQVRRLAVPVVVLPGNHDLYDANSLYFREPFQNKPNNFHLLTSAEGGKISLPELTLDLWGRAMPSHTPEFKPLLNMPAAENGNWLVALAHAHFHFDYDTDRRSAPIYPQEVAEAPCDYLALGHWDRHVEVSQGGVKAIYSGAPLGASPTDDTVAVTVVDLDPAHGVQTHQVTLDR
jgi:DNA repair exonuclease SbcCD nuclease subunit